MSTSAKSGIKNESEIPIYKKNYKGRNWKILDDTDTKDNYSLSIKDPKLKQGWVGDLEKKTAIELQDLFQRQEKLVKNRGFLSKLKDGGVHIERRYKEIKEALKKAQRIEGKADSSVPEDPAAYEWTGNMDVKESSINDHNQQSKDVLDSDDEDTLPWSTHQMDSVPLKTKSNTKFNAEEIDPAEVIAQELQRLNMRDAEYEDLSIKEKSRSVSPRDFGTKRVIMLEEKRKKNEGKFRAPIKTHKPLASKNIFLQKENKKHDPRLWDDSVSTDCARRPVKTISLEESYQLQQKDQERTQARELRDTAERLSRTTKMPIGVPKGDLTNYRDRNEEKHVLDSDGEDEEDSNQPGGLVASNENDDDDDDYLHL